MKDIENITSTVPYMTSPGNHEEYMNFSYYLSFYQPLYYSWNLGQIHFISYTTSCRTNKGNTYFEADIPDYKSNLLTFLEK